MSLPEHEATGKWVWSTARSIFVQVHQNIITLMSLKTTFLTAWQQSAVNINQAILAPSCEPGNSIFQLSCVARLSGRESGYETNLSKE